MSKPVQKSAEVAAPSVPTLEYDRVGPRRGAAGLTRGVAVGLCVVAGPALFLGVLAVLYGMMARDLAVLWAGLALASVPVVIFVGVVALGQLRGGRATRTQAGDRRMG